MQLQYRLLSLISNIMLRIRQHLAPVVRPSPNREHSDQQHRNDAHFMIEER